MTSYHYIDMQLSGERCELDASVPVCHTRSAECDFVVTRALRYEGDVLVAATAAPCRLPIFVPGGPAEPSTVLHAIEMRGPVFAATTVNGMPGVGPITHCTIDP